MATLNPNFAMKPRRSTETDRRHLLADSVAPSESASMVSYNLEDGDRTPRAGSPSRASISATQGPAYERRDTIATPSATPRPYRGFPSEAHYLAALREWAESKKYLDVGTTLVGFYGAKSMADYNNQPGLELGGLGLKKKWKARKEKKAEQQAARRNTVT